VALSIKFGDSVLKTLAVSGSILFASVVDHYVLGGPLTGQMCIAGVVTVIAIINYAFDGSSSAPATTTLSAADNAKSHSKDTDLAESGTGTHARGSRNEHDEWQDNETIEMRPLVNAKEVATNRRSNVPV